MCPIHVVMWEPAGFLAGKWEGLGPFSREQAGAGAWGAQASGALLTGLGLFPHAPTADYGIRSLHKIIS